MITKTTEKGQALILIALAAVGLFAFAALAIDGSRVYSEKRHAQNAADTAALAGALAYTRATDTEKANEPTIYSIIADAAQTRATSNSYNNNGTSNEVTITATDVPTGECPGGTDGKDITVQIVSHLNTTFTRVLGRQQVTSAVTATARACGYVVVPPFNGSPIVGLNDVIADPCGIDSKNGDWKIKGGGVFSNGCAAFHKKLELVDPGSCVTSVGTVVEYPTTPGVCYQQNQSLRKIRYPEDVLGMMPPNPCDGDPGDIGIIPPPASSSTTFENGVFCISDLDSYDMKEIVLNNATLYVTDTHFDLKFTGHGGLSGTATQKGTYTGSEDYHGYFMIIALHSPACTDYTKGDQVIVIRGNSGQDIVGTILAPSSCLDLRGTSDGKAMNSQVIGYTVSSNGDATVDIQYDPNVNPKVPIYPTISQLK
ncbi:MAG: Tad domain-containing protein [Anaerolineales bacterium]|nr:Tad domain-containing protein [Anaerolineales bacterium]